MVERKTRARKSGSKKKSAGSRPRSQYQEAETAQSAADGAAMTVLPSIGQKPEDETTDDTGEDKRDSGFSPSIGYMTPMNKPTSPTDWSADKSSVAPSERVPAFEQNHGTESSETPKQEEATKPAQRTLETQPKGVAKPSEEYQRKTNQDAAQPEKRTSAWGKGRECRPLPSNPLAGIPRPAHGQALPMVKQRVLEERQRNRDKAFTLLEEAAFRGGTSHEDATNYGRRVLAQPEPQPKKKPEAVKTAPPSNVMGQPQQGFTAQVKPQPRPQARQQYDQMPSAGGPRTMVTSHPTAQPQANGMTQTQAKLQQQQQTVPETVDRGVSAAGQSQAAFAAQPQPQQYNAPQPLQPSTGAPGAPPHAPNVNYPQPSNISAAGVGGPSGAPAAPQKERANKAEDSRLIELVHNAHKATIREWQLMQKAEEELQFRETITEEARTRENETRQLGYQELEALEQASKEASQREAEAREEIHQIIQGLREEAEQAARRATEYEEQSTELIEQHAQGTREANMNAIIAREKLDEDVQAKQAITKSALDAEKEVRETYRHCRELSDAATNNERIARANLKNRTGSDDIGELHNGSAGIPNQGRAVPQTTQNEITRMGFQTTQPKPAVDGVGPHSGAAGFQSDGGLGAPGGGAGTVADQSRTVPQGTQNMAPPVRDAQAAQPTTAVGGPGYQAGAAGPRQDGELGAPVGGATGSAANQFQTVPQGTRHPTTTTQAAQPATTAATAQGLDSQPGATDFQGDAGAQEGVTRPAQPARRESMGESIKKDAKKKRNRFSNWFRRNKKDKDLTESATSGQDSQDGSSSILDPAEKKAKTAAKKTAMKNAAKNPELAMKGANLAT